MHKSFIRYAKIFMHVIIITHLIIEGSSKVKVIFINSDCIFKAWSLSKKSSDKEKERSKLLSALAKKPTISGQASTKKVIF